MGGYRLFVSTILFCCIMGADILYADIFRYIDHRGELYITNAPVQSDNLIYLEKIPSASLIANVSDKYDYYIARASVLYDVPFPLIKAIIKVESNFNPKALSKTGAAGLMQIMSANYKSLGIDDPFDPLENIMGGTLYLKKLYHRYDRKLLLALAAYNAGPGNVDQFEAIPPFSETENFVKKVMTYYHLLKKKGG